MQAGIHFKTPKNIYLLKEYCLKICERENVSINYMCWTYKFQNHNEIGEKVTEDSIIHEAHLNWDDQLKLIETNQSFIMFLEAIGEEEANENRAILFETTIDEADTWTFRTIKVYEDSKSGKACFEFEEENHSSLNDFLMMGFEIIPLAI